METDNDRNNRILIVDDEENIHQDFEDTLKPILAKTLTDDLAKEFGSRVDENPLPEFELLHARSGKEAYEKVKTSLEENNPIAVVFMDIKMKQVDDKTAWDGDVAARRIREIWWNRPSNSNIFLLTF